MKRLFIVCALCFCMGATAFGQKLSKKQAREVVQTVLTCLKASDSASFVKMWYLDGKPAPYHENPFTEKSVLSYFSYLKEFVDTALTRNIPIDKIEISKVDAGQQALNFGKYNIKVWFKYKDKYYKGIGFFMDYINDKWVIRYIPETSTLNGAYL